MVAPMIKATAAEILPTFTVFYHRHFINQLLANIHCKMVEEPNIEANEDTMAAARAAANLSPTGKIASTRGSLVCLTLGGKINILFSPNPARISGSFTIT